ncbi:MAG TPA: glutathione transferase GstA [Burkholderiales bacterium]|nr:glutathione transferase GstA [Burkholderiales bacterium]
MKLYYAPGACSLSPHIVAREAGIPLELEKVDLGTKITASGEDYRAINPKGYVPALRLDDGTLLTEGPAIVQYLVDQKPQSGLAPQRYRLAEWLAYLNSEVHKVWSGLWNPKGEHAPILEKLKPRLAFLEQELKDRPFLLGERFTAADAYLFTLLNWGQWTKVSLPTPLAQYAERVRQRPKVQEALKAEGLQ